MSKVSIRQPLMLYALVFMVLLGFVVVTIASFSVIQASQRSYRRAAAGELRAIAATLAPGAPSAHPLRWGPEGASEAALVSAAAPSGDVDLAAARRAADVDAVSEGSLAVLVAAFPEETYLVASIGSVPRSIAFVEISRMLLPVLLAILAAAALMAFMMSRLLLPPLESLAEVAEDARPAELGGLVAGDAPNEIAEVAQRFRRTVRLLNAERELVEEQRDELGRMQESLVRASKLASVGRLAAGIAHEIGNPLAAVHGYLSLMKAGLEEPQRTEVLERSLRELDRIHATIKKLLTYARQGETASEPRAPFASGRIVKEAVALVRGHPALRAVSIEDTLEDRERLDAYGHAQRLNQVLVNLLLNAGQAMEGRNPATIRITRQLTPETVEIQVEDDGPGIPPELRASVFDPFYTTKDPGEGTGLGLAVSRALMEAMGGDLALRDGTGTGACFTVRLPRATGD